MGLEPASCSETEGIDSPGAETAPPFSGEPSLWGVGTPFGSSVDAITLESNCLTLHGLVFQLRYRSARGYRAPRTVRYVW